MIVHLQPVDTCFICKLCRLYTSKMIPEMNRSWENSFKANFNVGDRSFLVRWRGDHLNYFGILKEGATPKKFYDEDGGSSYSSNPTAPPPPPHKKWKVPEWSTSRVNGCWNVWKNSLRTRKHAKLQKCWEGCNFFYLFYPLLSPAHGPVLNKP